MGLRDPADLIVTSRLVLEYTVVHGALFALFGWAMAGLFALASSSAIIARPPTKC